MAWEGLKVFQTRFGSFFGSFLRFSNRFSYRFKSFSGAISFCRHAALTVCSDPNTTPESHQEQLDTSRAIGIETCELSFPLELLGTLQGAIAKTTNDGETYRKLGETTATLQSLRFLSSSCSCSERWSSRTKLGLHENVTFPYSRAFCTVVSLPPPSNRTPKRGNPKTTSSKTTS